MTTTLAVILAIISLWPLAKYLIMPRQDPFNPLVFFGTATFFVADYGVLMHHQMALRLVSDDDLSTYLIVAILSLLGFYLGWHLRRRRETKHPPAATISYYRPNILLNSSLVLAAIGVTIALYTRDDFTITGYLRDLGGLWVAAAILAIEAMYLNPAMSAVGIVTTILCIIPPIDRFFSYGQRGDTFRMALICIPFFVLRGRRPARVIFVPVAICLALTLGTLVRTRTLLANGEATGRLDALFKVIPSFLDETRSVKNYASNEYIFGTAMVATVRDQQSYEYGAFLYNIAIRFVPKEAFNKLSYFTRWNSTNYNPLVSNHAGFEVPGGAAPSGFAHVFTQFGWGAPLFWLALGALARWFYARAVLGRDLAAVGYMTAFFVVLMYLITQDLLNFTMNTVYTFPALFLVYRVARVRDFPVEDATSPDFQPQLEAV